MSCPHGIWHEDDCEFCAKENILYDKIYILQEEITELRKLIHLIFESTPVYDEKGIPLFTERVVTIWNKLSPNKYSYSEIIRSSKEGD